MLSKSFFNLKLVKKKHYQLIAEPRLCTPVDFLYGGSSLGAAVEAFEMNSNRPLVWASSQFISYAKPDDVLDLVIDEPSNGRNFTQARLTARVGEQEIFSVSATLGAREIEEQGQWAEFPEVLPVESCGEHKLPLPDFGEKQHIHNQQEYLSPFNDTLKRPDNKHLVWVKVKNADHDQASILSFIADLATASGNYVLKKRVGGNSLDNTIRVVKLVPTEWVLFEAEVHGIQNGIATTTTKLWSQDKQLMAVASQSFIVRVFG